MSLVRRRIWSIKEKSIRQIQHKENHALYTYNFIDDSLVGVEVESKTRVVLLNEYSGSPFGGFGTDAALKST